jgi:site-specific DNA recombinase
MKMKNVVIYTRVSTDEQAQRGFSLRDQKDKLEKYCLKKGATILAHYQDDHSAKTFKRPEFIKLMEFVKKNGRKVDTLVVVKWDRFSRNSAESYRMIAELLQMGVKVVASEQELDEDIPENAIVKAIYLITPEVENKRRSMNTQNGMRKAMFEGRYMSKSPIGYKDGRDFLGKRVLVVSEKATLVQEAFNLFATGLYDREELRKKLKPQGMTLSKDGFARMLKNPVYMGKVFVPAHKDDQEQVVDGIHEAIISEELFFEVAGVLNRRSKTKGKSQKKADEFPLRGILVCSKCGRNLTGSISKGNGGSYSYYHCQYGCKERFTLDDAHKSLSEWLQPLTMSDKMASLYLAILEDVFKDDDARRKVELDKLHRQREENRSTFTKASYKFVADEIDKHSFKTLKNDLDTKLQGINDRINEIEMQDSSYEEYCKYGFSLFSNLGGYFKRSEPHVKRKMIGLIFPEKLVYEDKKYRTNTPSEIFQLLFNINKAFDEVKIEKAPKVGSHSSMVARTRIELVIPP